MNRKFLLTTIFSTFFFIIFLGMVTPCLSKNRGKPRPHAVIEQVDNAPEELGKKQTIDTELSRMTIIITPRSLVAFIRQERRECPAADVSRFTARAPPLHLPVLS